MLAWKILLSWKGMTFPGRLCGYMQFALRQKRHILGLKMQLMGARTPCMAAELGPFEGSCPKYM